MPQYRETIGDSLLWPLSESAFVEDLLEDDPIATGSASGTIAATTDNTTSSISGAFGPSGTISASTAATTSSIAANFGPSGTIAANTANTTSAVTANFGPFGTIAATTADTTSSISGSFTGSSPVTGTIAATTADTTSALTGAYGPSGSLTGTLQDTTGAFSGTVANPVSGTIAITLDNTTSTITGIGGVVVDEDSGSHGAYARPQPIPYRPAPKPSLWEKFDKPESLTPIKGYMFATVADCGLTSAGVFDNTPNLRRAQEDELLLVLV